MSRLFASGGQRIGVSASTSVLPTDFTSQEKQSSHLEPSPALYLNKTSLSSCFITATLLEPEAMLTKRSPQSQVKDRGGHSKLYFSSFRVQPPLSMEFFRQEDWSGLPCPPSVVSIYLSIYLYISVCVYTYIHMITFLYNRN